MRARGWRVETTDGVTIAHADARTFDEIAVGGWLHVEHMDARRVFVEVAGLAFWVKVDQRTGLATIEAREDRRCSECGRQGGAGGHTSRCREGRRRAAEVKALLDGIGAKDGES